MDLKFSDFISEMNSHFTNDGWTKVSDDGMFCGLVDQASLSGVMASYGWDLLYQESSPVVEMTV